MATLFSKEGLGREMGMDRRMVARALDGVAADGMRAGKPVYHLRTLLDAMGLRRDADRPGADPTVADDEVTRAAHALVERIEAVRAEPDLTKRRAILRRGVPLGAFVAAGERFIATLVGVDRTIAETLINRITHDAVAETLALGQMQIGGDSHG